MDSFMTRPDEAQPASVPTVAQTIVAQQAGEPLFRWGWGERTVWTERMLKALADSQGEGVKKIVWFRLIDKVYSERNLRAAFEKVARNDGAAGVDHITAEEFGRDLDNNLGKLAEELRLGLFRPQAIRRVWIPKPGSAEQRPLGIPTVRDRIVQAAVVHLIMPIFEVEFAERSYGFRPHRGCKDALRCVDQLLDDGHVHVVDADLKAYFDTIPHGPLMARLRERIADGPVLALIELFLKADIMTDCGLEESTAGAPQGAVLSPLLSNIYLNPLDHLMAQQGFQMVRYADDFVILSQSADDAERALNVVRDWTAAAGLTLHSTKTRIVDVRQDSFDFLGYHFATVKDGSIRHWPRKKSLDKLKDTLREKTRRTNGNSLKVIIQLVNQSLVGWFGYFQHSYYTTFSSLDSWIRMRLRSILRKRKGGKGCGRGSDHHKWPNAYFAEHGLFNLTAAHKLALQSCPR